MDEEVFDCETRRGHVLVIDDDRLCRRALLRILERAGYVVVVASSGAEALELLDSSLNISLILTDDVMPGLDCASLAHQIRAIPRYADVPIVVATSHRDELDDTRPLLNAFVGKPFVASELRQTIRWYLGPGPSPVPPPAAHRPDVEAYTSAPVVPEG